MTKSKKKSKRQRCAVCQCSNCTCGDNCQCTEEMCRCAASTVMDSVKTRHQPKSCCGTGGGAAAGVGAGSNNDNDNNNNNNNGDPLAGAAAAAEPEVPETSQQRDEEDQGGNNGDNSVSSFGHSTTTDDDDEEEEADDGMVYKNKVELWIEGMTCSMCSQAIERAVRGVTNVGDNDDEDAAAAAAGMKVTNCSVSLATDTAVVEWKRVVPNDDDQLVVTVDDDVETIQEAIEAIGYTVESVLMLSSTATSAANSKNDRAGSTTTSRSSPTANSSSNNRNGGGSSGNDRTANNNGADSSAPASSARQPASSTGRTSARTRTASTNNIESMDARWRRLQERQRRKVVQRRNAFLWSLAGAIPVLMLTMVLPHVAPGAAKSMQDRRIEIPLPLLGRDLYVTLEALILWIFATPVQFICGWHFYRMSYHNLRSGQAGMDVLVALGTSASYVYAMYGSIHSAASAGSDTSNGHTAHFFETSVTLIAFVLAGKWMQAMAVRKTSQALTELIQLRAKFAIKVTPFKDRQNFHPLTDPYMETTVPIEDVREGDLLKIVLGAQIPADGRVVFGEVAVDESMITGESMPGACSFQLLACVCCLCVRSGRLTGLLYADTVRILQFSFCPVLKSVGSLVLGGTVCVETSSSSPTRRESNRSDAGASEVIDDGSSRATGARNRKMKDSNVLGAAFVNVTGVGSETALAQIVQLVQDAVRAICAFEWRPMNTFLLCPYSHPRFPISFAFQQTRSVPVQNFADQIAAIFVPTVCAISLFTYLVWYALCSSGVVPKEWYTGLGEDPATFSLMFGIACLVISCPCALGLATPTAVMGK